MILVHTHHNTHRLQIKAVRSRLDRDGIEMPANIVVLQATPSFRAALHGDAQFTPAGNVRPDRSDSNGTQQ